MGVAYLLEDEALGTKLARAGDVLAGEKGKRVHHAGEAAVGSPGWVACRVPEGVGSPPVETVGTAFTFVHVAEHVKSIETKDQDSF